MDEYVLLSTLLPEHIDFQVRILPIPDDEWNFPYLNRHLKPMTSLPILSVVLGDSSFGKIKQKWKKMKFGKFRLSTVFCQRNETYTNYYKGLSHLFLPPETSCVHDSAPK